LDGFGAVLPPPMTYILLQKLSARVSAVALGMLAIALILFPPGLYTKEFVVSVRTPAVISLPPPVKMRVPMVVVGM
jgi:hypothetical protein